MRRGERHISTDQGLTPTLGEQLKRRREERGIELSEISQATCIGLRFLRAIEEDDFQSLPGGLFTRSFIRAYARYVGMDETAAIELYYRQIGSEAQKSYDLPSTALPGHKRSSTWANVTIASAVLVVLVIGGIAGWHYLRRARTTKQPVTTPPTHQRSVAQPPPPPPEEKAPSPRSHADEVPGTTNTRSSPRSPKREKEAQQPEVPSKASPPQRQPSASVAPPRVLPTVSRSTPSPPRAQLRMSVVARDDSRLSVQTDESDPQTVILPRGHTRIFTANDRLIISADDLSRLNITINGHQLRFPQQPSPTDKVIITPQNLHRFILRQ